LETPQFPARRYPPLIPLGQTAKSKLIACHVHPKFTTTHLARELAEQNGGNLFRWQHHHAHVAALMAEHGVEMGGRGVGGFGYGVDGLAGARKSLLQPQLGGF
jgi:hydrogenase maturation protein HypF